MSLKITGLDDLQRTLENAQRALASLDGTLTTLKFEPNDPASVEAAIQQMERAIDGKVSAYAQNPLIAPLVAASKKHFRDQILTLTNRETASDASPDASGR